MRKRSELKSVAAVLSAGVAVGLGAGAPAAAADNPFAVTEFEAGYMVAAEGACGAHAGEGGCGAHAGEGGCGASEGTGDDDKSGEGRCGD